MNRISGSSPFEGKDFSEILESNKRCKIVYDGLAFQKFQAEGIDLLKKMLEISPKLRIGATQSLSHSFFSGMEAPKIPELKDESNVEDCDDEAEIANNIMNFQKK